MAKGSGGVHFEPEILHECNLSGGFFARNQIRSAVPGKEIACIFEDEYAQPEKRYKLLYTRVILDTGSVRGELYTSAVLIN